MMIRDDVDMICAGGQPFSPDEKEIFQGLGIYDRVHYFSPADDELAFLYRHALAFIFPSLYEGFGIPVLESFACNCPVILSRVGSLPEVAGDAAVYFDPLSEEDIRSSIERVMRSESLREQLKLIGAESLKQFSWDKTAERTIAVYKKI